MLTSLALIFLVGLAMAAICAKCKLPRIIGMLVTGAVLGPYVLDYLDASILGISSQLRQMALIIILIKAGLSLQISDLKKVGRSAVLMAFLPALCELLAVMVLAPGLCDVSVLDAAIIGAVLGAVSPAVVVPKMVQLMENKYGTDKGVPQMILAGASLDDVFVIVLFTAFVGMAQGQGISAMSFVEISESILLGIGLGAAAGYLLAAFWEWKYAHKAYIRNSTKVIILLGLAFLLMACETWLEGKIAVSGLLAVMSMACVVQHKCSDSVSKRLSQKFGKLWIASEVILFVLVGAAVDLRFAVEAGVSVIVLILLALVFRSIGVWLCLLGTNFNAKERLFCIIAYLPKATVQAAIGSVPLSLGLPCGKLVLTIAVVSILLTAPLGAIGMDLTYQKLLKKEH